MPATRHEMNTFDLQRRKALGYAHVMGSMSIIEIMINVRGGVRMADIERKYPTIGEFMEAPVEEILRMPNMGRAGMRSLYDTLERFALDAERKHGPVGAMNPGVSRSATDGADGEIARIVDIERRLAKTPLPDGSERDPRDVAQAAIAIYSRIVART